MPRLVPKKPETETQRRFIELATRWREETAMHSSPYYIASHPDFPALAALGDEVVPLVLHQLQTEPWVGWFALLTEITGERPAEDTETVPEASERWLAWGQARYGVAEF